jgi:inosine-uridine nucleoside N-ribohydrolase
VGEPKRRVLLDADVGIDDAVALIYLLARGDVEIVALGSVHGNCSAADAALNAMRVFEVCGRRDIPVAVGSSDPLEQPVRLSHYVHGRDGLGDVGFPAPLGNLSDEHAVDQLIRLAREEDQLDLLAVGPLTNLGQALRRDPDLLTRFASVVVMGGSGPFPPAPQLLEADSNIDNDQAAAALVFSAPRRHLLMVGVNVCTPHPFDEESIAVVRAAGTPQAQFASRIIDFYTGFYQYHWGRRICPMYDAIAAALLVAPDAYMTGYIDGPVNVRTDGGAGRGWLMKRLDGGPLAMPGEPAPDTRVAVTVDGPAINSEICRRLVEPLPHLVRTV